MTNPSNNALTGKVAIVTGGASGIGLEVVKQLVSLGSNVTLVDLSQASLDASVTSLDAGNQVLSVQGDTTLESTSERATAETLARWGRVDYAVLAAGTAWPTARSFLDTSEKEWDFIMGVNAKGGGSRVVERANASLLRHEARDQGHAGLPQRRSRLRRRRHR